MRRHFLRATLVTLTATVFLFSGMSGQSIARLTATFPQYQPVSVASPPLVLRTRCVPDCAPTADVPSTHAPLADMRRSDVRGGAIAGGILGLGFGLLFAIVSDSHAGTKLLVAAGSTAGGVSLGALAGLIVSRSHD